MVAVTAIALMTLQSKVGPIRPFWFMGSLFDRANSSYTYIKDGLDTFVRVASLNEKELAGLRRLNAALRTQERDYRRLVHENARLRSALEFADQRPNAIAVARVVSRGGDRLSNIVVINKGANHGVRKDMVVIVPEGLVGKVLSTQEEFSRVLLIDDPGFSVAVRLDEQRTEGVFTGSGNGQIKYIDSDIPLSPGLTLSTSGMDALFPPGIAVGNIVSVKTDARELFHRVSARPAADLSRLEEVVIVTR